jgi:hypothetical protein
MVCKMFETTPLTLYQMCVEAEERKFRHKAVGCSEDFSNILKILCYENLRRMTLGPLVRGH